MINNTALFVTMAAAQKPHGRGKHKPQGREQKCGADRVAIRKIRVLVYIKGFLDPILTLHLPFLPTGLGEIVDLI